MKKIFLTFIVCIFSFSRIISQSNFPPVYEITSDTAYLQELDSSYYQMLEDKSGNLTLDQVTNLPYSNHFHTKNSKPTSADSLVNTYWFRYSLKNVMESDISIALFSYRSKADFYVFDSLGKSTHFLTGTRVAWSKKNGIKTNNTIPITLKTNEKVIIYYRRYNEIPNLPEVFNLQIYNNEKNLTKLFIENQDSYYTTTSFFPVLLSGFLLFAALFNFFFYITVKERMYLYFSLWLMCLSFTGSELILEGLRREYYRFSQVLELTIDSFLLFFLLQFIRHYFQTFRYTKRWDKFLKILSFLWFLIPQILIFFPLLKWPFDIVLLGFVIVVFCSSIITLIIFKRLHHDNVRPFLIAVSPLIFIFTTLSLVDILFHLLNLNDTSFYFRLMYPAGLLFFVSITWMVVYFTWTLFMRYDNQSKELSKQALELERIAREKVEERNRLIESQKIELEKQVEERTADLNHSLHHLKSTQAQLIQSEKMASLGELTAGIAHEIQNPLNFVNNFSEVSNELIAEVMEERKKEKGERDEALEEEILGDIKENLTKINHHGQRASSIVKGMLEHSRKSSGTKEPTDINALCDEYLRLTFNAFKSKEKDFNPTMETHFDPTLPKIDIIPQDIGRVILNIINNAFYAVAERSKKGESGYEPTVSVSTKRVDTPLGAGGEPGKTESIQISISDNGSGIPVHIKDKIFQPFFTTKPTGQGTGLGLSLAYDIVKAHGGELRVEGKEGEGTTFNITLPK